LAAKVKKNGPNLPAAPARVQSDRRLFYNETRSSDAVHFFTIGYTGRSLSNLLELLEAHGVRTLVDIRHNPVSMYRPELSRSNLKHHVESRGLAYVHVRDLGVPTEIRKKAADAGSREYIWQWYDENVITQYAGGGLLHWFFNALEHPVALMCVEIDPTACHRHRLSFALEDMGLRGFDL